VVLRTFAGVHFAGNSAGPIFFGNDIRGTTITDAGLLFTSIHIAVSIDMVYELHHHSVGDASHTTFAVQTTLSISELQICHV